MRVMEEARGASLNAIEINKRLGQDGALLAMSALYRDLKRLVEAGRLNHEWTTRNGHVSSVYRIAAVSPPAAPVRLMCSACASAVDMPATGPLSQLIAQACNAQGMPVSSDPIEIRMLCRRCGQLPQAASPGTDEATAVSPTRRLRTGCK